VVFRANLQTLLDSTGQIPLGIYECPKPYWRLLSPETMKWVASTGRFYTFKDTCCSIPGIQQKLAVLKELGPTNFKFFNANMATLLDSISMGGNGFCGIAANCYPHLISWLCRNAKTQQLLAQKLQYFLSVFELTVATKYPQSAKHYLQMNEPGFKGVTTKCRTCRFDFTEEELIRIRHLKQAVDNVVQQETLS